jgi:hypothetical protein
MIFASLELEREPPLWSLFPIYLITWLQVAGGVAAIALVLWGIHYYAEKKYLKQKTIPTMGRVVLVLGALAVICYAIGLFSFVVAGPAKIDMPVGPPRWQFRPDQTLLLAAGGFFALAAVLVPMLGGLVRRLSVRRIGAIARLSIKEAIRQRVIYVVGLVALIFLFAPYFISTTREEHQLRNYVLLIHTTLAPLFLVTALFLGSFSIPNDVQRQTIHTIVTKPVEKYEIVLGRFLGYGALLTVLLAGLTVLALGYLLRGVNARAAHESFKARVPVFADNLSFLGTGAGTTERGINVGREWDYRSYIHGRQPGSTEPRQFALFAFRSLPRDMVTAQKPATVELTFDIYRTTTGKENKGVNCSVIFASSSVFLGKSGDLPLTRIETEVTKLREKWVEERNQTKDGLSEDDMSGWDKLSEQYGVYKKGNLMVTDYHTQSLQVPAGLLRRVVLDEARLSTTGARPPALLVLVHVEDDAPSAAQYVGVAKRDLYLLATELPFWQNFGKMMIGLWCNTLLILGVAIACSTYLSGIVSLLTSLFLLGAGALSEYMRSVAAGTNIGGGPVESASRLYARLPLAAPLEQTAASQLGSIADDAFRWVLGFVLNLIPDLSRFDLTEYVASGFNISWGQIILLDNFLPLVGYLIPWAILSYYLMNYREIANPT